MQSMGMPGHTHAHARIKSLLEETSAGDGGRNVGQDGGLVHARLYARSICHVYDVGVLELAAGVVKDMILILEC